MRSKVLEATTKTEAVAEARAFQANGDDVPRATGTTVAELAADYLAHLASRVGHRDPKRRYSARTVDLYRQRIEKYITPALGRSAASGITRRDVAKLIETIADLSPSTATSVLNILSALLRFGGKHDPSIRNVVADLDREERPGTQRLSEPRYLEADDLARILSHLSDTFRPAVATCTYAGLRISEALGLRWQDVDFQAKTLTVSGQLGPKGTRVPTKTPASAATLPMLPALVAELKAHRDRQASTVGFNRIGQASYVFQTANGQPQSRRNALRALQAACDTLGLNEGREKVGLHDLRHSYCAVAFRMGVPVTEVAALARHASPRVTLAVYGGIADDGAKRATDRLSAGGFGKA
jgi:integrase